MQVGYIEDGKIKFVSWEESEAIEAAEQQKKKEEREQRRLAVYNSDHMTIDLNCAHDQGAYYVYEVNLEEMTTVNFIDWIFHLREKIWFTPQMQDDFFAAFEEACEDNRNCVYTPSKWKWRKAPFKTPPSFSF